VRAQYGLRSAHGRGHQSWHHTKAEHDEAIDTMPLGEAPQRDVRERTDEVDVPDQPQRRRGGGQPLSVSSTSCPRGEEAAQQHEE
jgi:hypothetical protein